MLHDGDIGDLGEDEDPGLVVDKLILLRLSSLGVRSTVILGLLLPPTLPEDERREDVEEGDPIEEGEEQFVTTLAGEGDRERRRKDVFPL